MILSFRGASEMSSPVWPQARLPTLAKVLGEMKGNQGQAAQAVYYSVSRREDISPCGDHTRVAVLDMMIQSAQSDWKSFGSFFQMSLSSSHLHPPLPPAFLALKYFYCVRALLSCRMYALYAQVPGPILSICDKTTNTNKQTNKNVLSKQVASCNYTCTIMGFKINSKPFLCALSDFAEVF